MREDAGQVSRLGVGTFAAGFRHLLTTMTGEVLPNTALDRGGASSDSSFLMTADTAASTLMLAAEICRACAARNAIRRLMSREGNLAKAVKHHRRQPRTPACPPIKSRFMPAAAVTSAMPCRDDLLLRGATPQRPAMAARTKLRGTGAGLGDGFELGVRLRRHAKSGWPTAQLDDIIPPGGYGRSAAQTRPAPVSCWR